MPIRIKTISREIDHPVESAWNAINDYENFHRMSGGVESIDLIDGPATGLGAQRVCHLYDGSKLVENISDYKEGELVEIDLLESPFPLKELKLRMSVESIDDSRTKISLDTLFQPKYGPIGWLMGNLMMKPLFKRRLKGLLKGIDDHLTTGRVILKNGKLGKAIES